MATVIDSKPITECFKITTGKLNSNAAVKSGKYPFFTCAKEVSEIDVFAFDQEALLLAGNNAQGEYDVKYYNGKFNAYQRTYILTLVNEEHDYGYFRHALQTQLETLKNSSKGTNTKYITMEILSRTMLKVPPPKEQRRIAIILDKAESIRRKRKQAIQMTNEFLQSVFLDMFGDPVFNPKGFTFGTVRDLVSSANYGTSGKASEETGQYPILRMGNITCGGGWDFTSLKYIDLTEKEKPKYLVENGDLLFNRTNSRELVGKTAVYDFDEPMAIAGYLIRVRPNNKANNYYISGYLNSSHGKQTLQSMCKSIVGMANINAQELQDIKIMIPPKALQDEYASIYAETQLKIIRLRKSLTDIDTLFSSLSQKAFSGEL